MRNINQTKYPPVPPLVPISNKLQIASTNPNVNYVSHRNSTAATTSYTPLPLLIPIANKPSPPPALDDALDEPVVIMPDCPEEEPALWQEQFIIDIEYNSIEDALQAEALNDMSNSAPTTDPIQLPDLTSQLMQVDEAQHYKCDHCNCHLASLSQLQCHETLMHGIKHYWDGALTKDANVNFTLICDECHMLLPNMTALTSHKMEHLLSKTSIIRKCKKCSKEFYNIETWSTHSCYYDPETLKACPTCNKQFRSMFLLQSHIRSHKDGRPYACNECDKTFKNAGYLKQHMERHTGELKYVCDKCPRRFTCIANRASHYLHVHKPHKHHCTFCQKSFARPSLLQVHLNVHTGDRPYRCEHCGKGFCKRGSLLKHLRGQKCLPQLPAVSKGVNQVLESTDANP